MEALKVNASLRVPNKKGAARKLRVLGKIPGVVYGNNKDNTFINLDYREIEKVFVKMVFSQIIELTIDDEKKLVLTKKVQYHPITDRIIHIDFYELTDNVVTKLITYLKIIGEPIGVRERAGRLSFNQRTLKIKCLPKNIPLEIDIDVSNLDINETIQIKDINLPEGVVVLENLNTTVASVLGKEAEETTEESKEEEVFI